MDAAEQLKKDTIAFVPRTQSASTEPPLQISMNPFVAGARGSLVGRPLQTAFGEVIWLIGRQTPVIVVVGSAGTGKSLLVDMTARACLEMGLSVRRVDRGDLVYTTFDEKADVLLIDQTDIMSNSSLQTLLAGGQNTATTMVFLCVPSCVGRISFSGAHAAVVELPPLALSDARKYLRERGNNIGRPNLFTPEALDLVIDGSRGLAQLLRSIAHLAFFGAASEGAFQINPQHVSNALKWPLLDDKHDGDADSTRNTRQSDITSRILAEPVADALMPRVMFENQERDADAAKQAILDADLEAAAQMKRDADVAGAAAARVKRDADAAPAAQTRFGARTRTADGSSQVNPEYVADTSGSRVAFAAGKQGDAKSSSVPPEKIIGELPTEAQGPALLSEWPSLKRGLERSLSGAWTTQLAGIIVVFLASATIVSVISSLVMNDNSIATKRARISPLVVSRPVEFNKAVVQTPALAKQAASSAKSGEQAPTGARKDPAIASLSATEPAVDPSKAIKGAAAQRPSVAAQAQTMTEAAVRRAAVTGTAVQPTPADEAAEEALALKLAEEKARVDREAADRVKAAINQNTLVISAAEQRARAETEAAEQAAALKLAEDKAQAQREVDERMKAAEQAFQAQEAARKAKVARDPAEQAKANQEAAEQSNARRRDAMRTFSYSIMGMPVR